MKHIFILISVLISLVSSAQSSLKGSARSQRIQNQEADSNHLSRIKNDKELTSMVNHGYLVSLPAGTITIDSRLQSKFRYVRPWTKVFLVRLEKTFEQKFGETTKLQVNSAVRTVEYQKSLRTRNGNAAKTTGPKRSSHLTGSSIDLAKLNLTHDQLVWLRSVLTSLVRRRLIEATEEHGQECFHIMVFKRYEQYVKKHSIKKTPAPHLAWQVFVLTNKGF